MKFYAPTKLSENIRETPEGYLLCLGVPIARTGEMVYAKGETPVEADSNGQVIIVRDEDAVFNSNTIASFEGKAFTITHPETFVSPDNWTELAKGILQNVRRGDGENKDDLLSDILVTDKIAIGLVKEGLREVSCGYDAEYIQIEKGRGRQENIIGNHCALVEKGRAGQSYAINDHDGKGSKMSAKFKETLQRMLGRTVDEAMKEMKDEFPEKKDEPKKEESSDANSMDAVAKMVKDLSDKIDSMNKPKDEFPKKEDKKEESSDDGEDKEEPAADDAGETGGMEDRLKALEASVAKLMENMSGESGDEDVEESEDDDGEDMPGMTGDSFARAEILCPGIKRSKDMKTVALKAVYGTKDGKAIIESLNGGKKPTFDSAAKVDSMFIAASEILKVKRSGDLSKTKQVRDSSAVSTAGGISPEEMNKRNAEFYNKK